MFCSFLSRPGIHPKKNNLALKKIFEGKCHFCLAMVDALMALILQTGVPYLYQYFICVKSCLSNVYCAGWRRSAVRNGQKIAHHDETS
jgi:hypothetical protein